MGLESIPILGSLVKNVSNIGAGVVNCVSKFASGDVGGGFSAGIGALFALDPSKPTTPQDQQYAASGNTMLSAPFSSRGMFSQSQSDFHDGNDRV